MKGFNNRLVDWVSNHGLLTVYPWHSTPAGPSAHMDKIASNKSAMSLAPLVVQRNLENACKSKTLSSIHYQEVISHYTYLWTSVWWPF